MSKWFDPEAKPIAHVSPYKRIDISNPSRKPVITRHEHEQIGGREPDPAVYVFNPYVDGWVLKA
ncbi:hypothetical protein IC762_12245 [Bradyrhizobium genosp. L]|uniref:hypothetical protein n=1 Tax=Bradyrhizobium genosp. L TaxID=83637 RepID=UPI0018A2A854|nr:hypothetical protein [Bradyrhizobium genosp. L]QPF87015.1 hypothetical protein IC762_12245 [Bradyrhizobium genosp. L]